MGQTGAPAWSRRARLHGADARTCMEQTCEAAWNKRACLHRNKHPRLHGVHARLHGVDARAPAWGKRVHPCMEQMDRLVAWNRRARVASNRLAGLRRADGRACREQTGGPAVSNRRACVEQTGLAL